MAVCSGIIEGSPTSWLCDIPNHDDDGPHMAHGSPKSMRERAEWVEAQEAAKAAPKLAEFQGEPQTTAERYTENPTEHPAVVKANKEDAAAQAVKVKDLILSKPDAPVCKFCAAGKHAECVHRAQLIAVLYYDQPQLEAWCSCFQNDKVAHGVPEDAGGDSGTPEPEPALGFGTHGSDGQPYEPEPTKQRDGDQVLPRPTGRKSVQERAIEKAAVLHDRGDMTDAEFAFIETSMRESIRIGTERYGSPLQTFNGRKTLQDAEDEARDWFVYLSALNQAAEASRADVIGLCEDAVKAANDRGESMGLTQVVTIVVDTIMGAVGSLSNIEWSDDS